MPSKTVYGCDLCTRTRETVEPVLPNDWSSFDFGGVNPDKRVFNYRYILCPVCTEELKAFINAKRKKRENNF